MTALAFLILAVIPVLAIVLSWRPCLSHTSADTKMASDCPNILTNLPLLPLSPCRLAGTLVP